MPTSYNGNGNFTLARTDDPKYWRKNAYNDPSGKTSDSWGSFQTINPLSLYCDWTVTEMCIRDRESGIVDPTKVTRSALQNAASVAAMVLTTESLVADQKEENPAAGMAQPPMGGMM